MDKLLKEAIADAKAVRETALANAKIALEEAFAPKLQSMLAAKINEEEDEMEDEEETTDEGTGLGVDYLGEKESDDQEEEMGEAASEEGGSEEATGDDEDPDESLDLEAIIRELEQEAKSEDENEEDMTETEDKDDEDINLDELLASLSEEEEEEEDMDEAKKMKKAEMDEAKDDEDEEEKVEEISRLQAELAEYRDAVVFLKDKINEINLLNAKLLYTNKLFRSNSLTEAQKMKVLESLDRTKTVREVKLVYSTLAESFAETAGKTKKKIAESLGFASKSSGKTQKAIITEGNSLAARFQELANINKKK